MSFDWQALMIGGGGSFLGYFGGVLHQSFSAEGKYNKRIDERIMTLESKVAECEKREPYIQVLTLALKMVVPEVYRFDKKNPVLRYVANALSALPAEDATFEELMEKLKEIPW